MEFLIQHGKQTFILVLFPFVGLALEIGLSSRKIRLIAIAALTLLIPLLFGYRYSFFNAFPVLVLILLACGYSFFSKQIQGQGVKFVAALLSGGLLLVVMGYAWFIRTMGGGETTEKKWKLKGYQIEYIVDKGFTGRGLMTYELYKLTFIPILMKKIEIVAEEDSKNCIVNFNDSKILFNKCSGTLQGGR
ncbi:hypothetical protein FAM09_23690 [Niastella caeni]|uniref:Uncharacterized protein n=1 Tax=Niastella caeni TaxID=2569763 RepID=A0A4S8HPP7_9BACT|nr:hypothetical protein [Niastella caeni]THU34992.1 hypothetical protein FAM09_23690 [Niastella caeni]